MLIQSSYHINNLKPSFVFYHIPKCGGTSMRYALNELFLNLYDQKQIYAPRISDTSNFNLVKKADLEKLLKCKTEEEYP